MMPKTPRDKNDTKVENRREVFNLFRTERISTVAEASELCGLSRATVHRIAEFLRKRKLLLAAGKGMSGDEGGKKPTLLTLNAAYRYILTYQMLANSLIAAVTDMRGTILSDWSMAFADNAPLDCILGHMKNAYETMAGGLHLGPGDFAGVVVGCHGVTNSIDGIISSSPYFPSWGSDIPFKRLTGELFDQPMAIYIDNSNRYDAYAELRIGQAVGCRNFIVIDGEVDGLGAGLVLDGTLWRGGRFLSGEIGHMTVDPSGARACTCGGRGCLETMASMSSLVEGAKKGYKTRGKSLLFKKKTPDEISFRDVYDSANAGDALARKAVEEQARWLAIGIANVSLVVDPDLVVLQGPYAKGGEYFLDRLHSFLCSAGLPRMKKDIRVAYSTFGRERGLVGGAHYVADEFFDDVGLYS